MQPGAADTAFNRRKKATNTSKYTQAPRPTMGSGIMAAIVTLRPGSTRELPRNTDEDARKHMAQSTP